MTPKPWENPQVGDVLMTVDGRADTVTGRVAFSRSIPRVQYDYVNAVGHKRKGDADLDTTWRQICRREVAKGGSYERGRGGVTGCGCICHNPAIGGTQAACVHCRPDMMPVTAPTPGLDVEADVAALRRLIGMARRGCAPYRPNDVVLDGERAERLLARLEELEELRDGFRLCSECGGEQVIYCPLCGAPDGAPGDAAVKLAALQRDVRLFGLHLDVTGPGDDQVVTAVEQEIKANDIPAIRDLLAADAISGLRAAREAEEVSGG